ncbi:MarR family transcriptional regulator [Flavobacteriales bacterium]|nr:MarR family transcriptional regulator [Flavobacteriales bacterium]MDG1175467.1 MarR family transcriptional regulator [Flavobacteriales bacterium]
MEYTDIIISLRKVIRSINLENKKIEKKYGVSTPQILILNFLKEKEDCQSTATELKKFLNLNASTVTGIISRLESKRLIARIPNNKDKRVVKISLTIEGIGLINKIPVVLHEKFAERLKKLDPKSIVAIQKSIEILVSLLDAEDIDASPVLSSIENLSDESKT